MTELEKYKETVIAYYDLVIASDRAGAMTATVANLSAGSITD